MQASSGSLPIILLLCALYPQGLGESLGHGLHSEQPQTLSAYRERADRETAARGERGAWAPARGGLSCEHALRVAQGQVGTRVLT